MHAQHERPMFVGSGSSHSLHQQVAKVGGGGVVGVLGGGGTKYIRNTCLEEKSLSLAPAIDSDDEKRGSGAALSEGSLWRNSNNAVQNISNLEAAFDLVSINNGWKKVPKFGIKASEFLPNHNVLKESPFNVNFWGN